MWPTEKPASADPTTSRSIARRAETPRKPYRPPEMKRWGSLAELTQGPINGSVDGNFSGSGGA